MCKRALTVLAGWGLVCIAFGDARAADIPHFVDETDRAGISHRYTGDWEFYVGGGVAAFDCNGDRYPDLFLAGGATPSLLAINAGSRGGTLAFTPLPNSDLALVDVTGAYPISIDNDEHVDLIILRVGENIVMRGLGDCRFERANERWGFDGGTAWSVAASAMWEPGASWPTIAIGNYVDRDDPDGPFGACHDNRFFRPSDTGIGFDPPLAIEGHCTLSMLFSDWNRSGRADLRVSNDRHYYREGQEQLWQVADAGPPTTYGEGDGWQPLKIWGMGIDSRDLTGDGYPEYFLSSMGDNKLRGLAAGADRPQYTDMAFGAGVTAHRPFVGGDTVKPSTAWHVAFEDINNDGHPDLFIAKGNVEAMEEAAMEDPNNLLLNQGDNRFVETAEAAGVLNMDRSRGAALVDLNLDGRLDLVVINREERARFWRNTGTGEQGQAGSLAVQLHQSGGNRDAIGAWIEVQTSTGIQRREVLAGGGHAGDSLGPIHFGVGSADVPRIRVSWPNGDETHWMPVAADSFVTIDHGSALPVIEMPPAAAVGQ